MRLLQRVTETGVRVVVSISLTRLILISHSSLKGMYTAFLKHPVIRGPSTTGRTKNS